MLNDKWIITAKTADKYTPGAYWYDILPVDREQGETLETYSKYLWSEKDFEISKYTDNNLNPIAEQYEKLDTDTAFVEMTSNPVQKTIVRQLSVFGRRFGEFNLLLDVRGAPFRIERGHSILLRWGYQDFANGVPIFSMLYNLTTKQKAKDFPKSKHDFGNCDTVVVLGIDSINPVKVTSKHLLVYSQKFGYVSCLFYENNPEFSSRVGDNLVIERYHDRNVDRDCYNILANTTIDKMRTAFVQKAK